MRKLEIADADVMRMAIQQEIARSDESRYDHRLHGLLLDTGGHSCQQVAELFGEDRRTVQRWVTRFETHGLTGLRDGARSGWPAMLNAKQWAALGRDLRREPQEFRHVGHLWDGKLLSAHLRLAMGWCWVCASANESSATWGSGCASPDPKSPSLTRSRSRVLKKLHRLAKRRVVELWSVDECHFQQHGTRCRMWVPPEIKDPVILHAPTRKSVACFGAVSLHTGKFVRSMCAEFNAATFETFLKTLLRHRSRDKRMYCAGQCQVPSRGPAPALASKTSRRAHRAVSAAVQSAAGPHRARLEVGPPHGDAQPVLRHLGRRADRRLNVLRPLEKPNSVLRRLCGII